MKVLLLQLDGVLPNLALMRVAAHHRALGDAVELRQLRRRDTIHRELFDDWDKVYASLIFTRSQPLARRVLEIWPEAVIGGTGWNWSTLEGIGIDATPDYSLWPAFRASIGFTQRGCRLDCKFCVVPKKEGAVRSVAAIGDIWRGEPWPRHLMLLDNDFFGQADWRGRIAEIQAGGFKVSFTQGINARMLSDDAAAALASIRCTDGKFKRRRIYTAWDSIGDERPLFRGLEALVRHGFRPDEIMVYLLIGFNDTEEDRLYRRDRLRAFGARPYPMPFDRTRPELMGFQRWVVRREDLVVPWERFKAAGYRPEKVRN